MSVFFLRGIASALIAYATRALPSTRATWGAAMENELEHIESDLEALRWAAGCIAAAYLQRSAERSFGAILKKPSAFLPVAMSLTALVVVLVSIAAFGVVHDSDEGAAAHIWQLLMAGQVPILAFFAVKWLPRAPRQSLLVLALQVAAALAAMAPVFLVKL